MIDVAVPFDVSKKLITYIYFEHITSNKVWKPLPLFGLLPPRITKISKYFYLVKLQMPQGSQKGINHRYLTNTSKVIKLQTHCKFGMKRKKNEKKKMKKKNEKRWTLRWKNIWLSQIFNKERWNAQEYLNSWLTGCLTVYWLTDCSLAIFSNLIDFYANS